MKPGRFFLAGLALSAAALASERDTEFLAAAVKGNPVAIETLLAAGADPNAATPTGETALHWATQADDGASVRRLLEAGAKISPNRYGITPLFVAATQGNAAMITLLLDAGAEASAAAPDGRTPLMMAAQAGRPEAVRALLARGASVNACEQAQAQTALMWAAVEGHAEAVKALLAGGADSGARSKNGFTAFLFAVRHGHTAVVELLLAAGASANESLLGNGSARAASALALAVTNQHYELGARLLAARADPNYTWQGRTVLHLVTWVSRPGAGSNDPAPDGTGTMDRVAFVRALVKHGADVNCRMATGRGGPRTVLNFKGATPFLLAARTADVELMRLLVELGADPKLPNDNGTTPLMAAAGVGVQSPGEDPGNEAEVLAAVKLAVELGNDVNAVDANGETALHGVAYKWAASSVPYLVAQGAKIHVWDRNNKNGWTPLRIAVGVHRGMNLRASPATAAALRATMSAAGVSTEVGPETNISGGTK